MKTIFITAIVTLIGIYGCCGKIVIPDEPKYQQIVVWPMESGVCIENDQLAVLFCNIRALKEYADSLKSEIEKHNNYGKELDKR